MSKPQALSATKTLTSEALSTTKTSVNALTYVTEKFTNAPPLTAMPRLAIKRHAKEKDLATVLTGCYEDDTHIEYLGNMLVKYYKKKDQDNQSLWNVDCSRLNYIVRTVVGKKESWIADKKGIQLRSFVIEPLLENIKEELSDYMKNPKSHNADNFLTLKFCIDLTKDINDNIVCEELVKFMAPHFQLDRTSKT